MHNENGKPYWYQVLKSELARRATEKEATASKK